MATKTAGQTEPADALRLIQQLVSVGKLDTVHRDIYFTRAANLLLPILSRAAYDRFKAQQAESGRLAEQNRRALERRDWATVKELASRAEAQQRDLKERAAAYAVAEELYDRTTVDIDPFSPGYEVVMEQQGQSLVEVRKQLVAQLETLAKVDADMAAFYTARRTYYTGLVISDPQVSTATKDVDPAELERQAARAAQAGDFERLAQLADELQRRGAAATKVEAATAALDATTFDCPVNLATPFPDDTTQRAAALGLAPAMLQVQHEEAKGLWEFLHRHAWNPRFREAAAQREGVVRLELALEDSGLPAELAGPIREFVELFLLQPYVNSGGARYLPAPRPETFLVEDFAETPDPPAVSPLLTALGLTQRHGLSRLGIDAALTAHGDSILRDQLGLDPIEYRIVCIPYDLYVRFGHPRGWGQQHYWTHFDGYQVMRGLQFRAIVGGSGKYGGVVDLVSISPDDARDGVIARFAVVRRARLVARWH
jgi:hypothetical protein